MATTEVTATPSATRWWRERSWWVAAALVLAAGAGGYGLYARYAYPDRRYAAVVRALADDPAALVPDGRGRVGLAGGPFAGLTPHDELFLVRRPDGSFVALFPKYYGAGSSIEGLLYTSRPFADGDTYLQQSTLGRAQTVINVGSYLQTKVVERVYDDDPHWFRVTNRM